MPRKFDAIPRRWLPLFLAGLATRFVRGLPHRGHGEPAGVRIERQLETARVAAVSIAGAGLRFQVAMTDPCATRRTAPRHTAAHSTRKPLSIRTDVAIEQIPPESGADLACPGRALLSDPGGAVMVEFWGLGVLVAVCRYFFNTDWELKVKRRRRNKKQHRA